MGFMLCCAASANVDILWTSAVLDHFTQKWKQGFGLRKLSQRYFGGDNTSVLSYYLIYLNSLYTLYTPVKLLDQSYVHNQKKLKTTVCGFNYGTEYLTVMWLSILWSADIMEFPHKIMSRLNRQEKKMGNYYIFLTQQWQRQKAKNIKSRTETMT